MSFSLNFSSSLLLSFLSSSTVNKVFCFGILLTLVSGSVKSDQIAPEFSLRELRSEQIISLSDFRGKVIYLDFWASWCGPCRQSLPALNKLQKEMHGKNFEVVAINLDANPQDGIRFLEQYPVDYTVLSDGTGGISRVYELLGLPTSVLIDQNGVVVSSFQGFHDSHIPKLKRAVNILLGDE